MYKKHLQRIEAKFYHKYVSSNLRNEYQKLATVREKIKVTILFAIL